LVDAWEDGGIPIGAVVLGIYRTFENAARAPQMLRRRIRQIAYCAPEVYGAYELIVEDEACGHGDLRKSLRRHLLKDRA
jgi:hypothetical protein